MSAFRARLVLLGASNVTKGISTIIETARLMLGSPMDVKCAIGHGRSYGHESFVLVRSLPSILDAGLWSILETATSDCPTYALIADVGNDVMYGIPPQQIADWVEQCIARLNAADARIVMTSLPLQRIRKLTPAQYLAARTLLFPGNRLTFKQVLQRSEQTVQQLADLAVSYDVPLVELPGQWYGIDPIHIRASRQSEAWAHVLAHWLDEPGPPVRARVSLRRWVQLRMLSPERWWLLGFNRGREQPAATLADGTLVSLY